MSENQKLQVAHTILEQLGGPRIKHFLGTKFFVGDSNSLMFDYDGCLASNKVKITLNDMDTYDIEFYQIRGTEFETVETLNDVYAEDLIGIYERTTGLYLHF